MKTYIGLAVAFFIGIGLIGWYTYQESVDFSASNEQLVSDITKKWVVIGPQGQLWGFSADQKISINTLETRPGLSKERAVVAIDLSASAAVPLPPEQPKEQNTQQQNHKVAVPETKSPLMVNLNGVAKMHYEKIAKQWYLVEVESVTLSVGSR